MTAAFGLQTNLPPDENELARRVNALARRIEEVAAARTAEATEISKGGITVKDGGSLRVIDSDGHVVAVIGALPSPDYDRADGTSQPGVMLNREDGSLALLLGDLNPTTPPFRQSLQILDRANRVVIADDTNSGNGLAAPHVVAYALQNTDVNTWPATANTSWTAIASGWHEVQNPYLQWSITLQADANTTGQFRLTVGGTQIGTTQTLSAGASVIFAGWAPAAVPVTSVPVGAAALLQLEAQRTAGTGKVRAQVQWLSGMQS